MVEIERKFMANNEYLKYISKCEKRYIRQWYILNSKEQTVRIRIDNDTAFLTIKGSLNGISRKEYEYEISIDDAVEMMEGVSEKDILSKIRYNVNICGKLWEIDEFLGNNKGLVVAEVELDSLDEIIELPEFCSIDISTDVKYLNCNLLLNPYDSWGF